MTPDVQRGRSETVSSWRRIWLPETHLRSIEGQREAITRLLNSGVIAADLRGLLGETAHVLAAVSRWEPDR